MERFEVKRGLIKQVRSDGGLPAIGKRHFDEVAPENEDGFTGKHGILEGIEARYESTGRLFVDVTQRRPDFDDEADMKVAMASRKAWAAFLDEATGYNSKQRGDKAKEITKKRNKAQDAVKSARSFMAKSTTLDEATRAQAEAFIEEIETALADDEVTRAFGRGEKLTKLLE